MDFQSKAVKWVQAVNPSLQETGTGGRGPIPFVTRHKVKVEIRDGTLRAVSVQSRRALRTEP